MHFRHIGIFPEDRNLARQNHRELEDNRLAETDAGAFAHFYELESFEELLFGFVVKVRDLFDETQVVEPMEELGTLAFVTRKLNFAISHIILCLQILNSYV